MQLSIKKQLLHIKQKLVAALLISCLLLAITPIEMLHDIFADHTDDTYELTHNTSKTQLAKDTIHCHFDSIFTVNALFSLPTNIYCKPDFHYFTQKLLPQTVYVSLQNSAAFLRGPPIISVLNLS